MFLRGSKIILIRDQIQFHFRLNKVFNILFILIYYLYLIYYLIFYILFNKVRAILFEHNFLLPAVTSDKAEGKVIFFQDRQETCSTNH